MSIHRKCHKNSEYVKDVGYIYIDDEIHFLISCSSFASQRTSLLAETKPHNSAFDSLSNNGKFTYIMTLSSTHRSCRG